jgi:hypothetical protein
MTEKEISYLCELFSAFDEDEQHDGAWFRRAIKIHALRAGGCKWVAIGSVFGICGLRAAQIDASLSWRLFRFNAFFRARFDRNTESLLKVSDLLMALLRSGSGQP